MLRSLPSHPPAHLVIALLFAMVAAPAGAQRYEVCDAQVRAYVNERLGQTVEHIDYRWNYGHSISGRFENSEALVYVKECEGFHWFELLARPETCQTQAHYGTPPDYVLYRSANGACATR